jgi:cytochrome P450
MVRALNGSGDAMQEVVANEAGSDANRGQVPVQVPAKVEEKRLAVPVDPSIASVIKSASRPVGVPALVVVPKEVPGRSDFIRGVQLVIGSLRRGIAASEEMRTNYGDIYRDKFLDRNVVFVWDADEIQKVVKNESQAYSSAMGWDVAMFQGVDRRGGNIGTLLSVDFDDHKAARALVQPAFTMKAIQGYLDIANRTFSQAVPTWVDQRSVKFKATIRTLLARVANDIFTGIREPEQIQIIDRALVKFWSGMMALSRNAWVSPTFRGSRRGFDTLYTTFLELAPQRRRDGGDDLFSHMVKAADGSNDDQLVRLFLTIMFGAFDTTSAAITSMAYHLAKHPEWQERVRTEALALTGPLDATNLRSLKELEWVWKETLRLTPVAGFVPRRSLREVKVGDYTLPAGTMVAPMVGGIGRHPKWWKEPHRFDPSRFSPERAEDKQHPALSMPFGAGAHSCIGTQLAGFEMKMLFHKMLTTCKWSLAKDYEANHTFTPMGSVSGSVALRLEPLST